MGAVKELVFEGSLCTNCGREMEGVAPGSPRAHQTCPPRPRPVPTTPTQELKDFMTAERLQQGPCAKCGFANKRHRKGNPEKRRIMRLFGKHEFEAVPREQWGQITGQRGKRQV